MLEREGLDVVLLNAQHNFAWLTGGRCNGVDLSRENGVAWLAVTRARERYVLANVIEIDRMLNEEISENEFTPIDFAWQVEKAEPLVVVESMRVRLDPEARIATDIQVSPNIPAIEGKIAACRHLLTSQEAERYRSLGRDASAAMDRTIRRIENGNTESEIAEQLRHELALGQMTSVVTLVAADERIAAYRHPVPTKKRFTKAVLLVTCAKRSGLIVSLSRIVSNGEPSDDLKMRTDVAASVSAALLHATQPGATGAELYHAAARAYTAAGFADEINNHHQGGATGYKTREWVAHPQNLETVQDIQAFAWNPSITGTKVEETCIASANGVEIITASAEVPTIKTTIGGTEYFSPGILSI